MYTEYQFVTSHKQQLRGAAPKKPKSKSVSTAQAEQRKAEAACKNHNMEVKISAQSGHPTCQRCSKCGYTEWF